MIWLLLHAPRLHFLEVKPSLTSSRRHLFLYSCCYSSSVGGSPAPGPFHFGNCLMASSISPSSRILVLCSHVVHLQRIVWRVFHLDVNVVVVHRLVVWSFHGCTGGKLLPSHIWYQKKRNCIPYEMAKSPLRSSLGKVFCRAINQARFTHVLTHIYCERNHDSYSHI